MKMKANVMVIAGTETHRPGDTFEIDDTEGRRLVERKLATPVKDEPVKRGRKAKTADADQDG